MTENQAQSLKPGQFVYSTDRDEPYRFVRLDTDGDLLVENPTGAPTLVALYRSRCVTAVDRESQKANDSYWDD